MSITVREQELVIRTLTDECLDMAYKVATEEFYQACEKGQMEKAEQIGIYRDIVALEHMRRNNERF